MRTTNLYLLWRLVAYRPFWYLVDALSWILFHQWPLIPGLLAKAFFDALGGSAPAGLNLTTIVALVAAAGLGRAGVVFMANVSGPRQGFPAESLLRRNLLARVLERPGARALPGNVGETLSTMRDDVSTLTLMKDWLFDVVAGLILGMTGVAILLSVDARVTLLVFAPITVVVVLAHGVRVRLESVRARSRQATARLSGAIGEIFSAVQAIQVAGAEGRVVAQFARINEERQQAMLRDRLQELWLDAIFNHTASLGAGLVLLVSAERMRSGAFSVGNFALFSTYLMQVAHYTGFLGYLIATYRQSGVSFRRVRELMQGAPDSRLVEHHPFPLSQPDAEPPMRALVRERLERLDVRDLTLRHPSGRGIEGVSFSLPRGSFTVITGRIGSGKTTLLRAVLGLLEPQKGEVRWNERRIENPADFLTPPRVAYTPQVPTLLSGTLRENILLGWAADESRLGRAVQSAVLEQDLSSFPHGLETQVGTRGVRLSGGQVQRTAAARMFVREPELLVFDDLSSALDVETERLLWDRTFARRATCLVVSHRRPALERADRILVLEDGRLTAQGRWDELLQGHPDMRFLLTGEQS